MTYVESLRELATLDVDGAAEKLADEGKAMRARTPAAREALAQSQLTRARKRVAEARTARAEARAALLLED